MCAGEINCRYTGHRRRVQGVLMTDIRGGSPTGERPLPQSGMTNSTGAKCLGIPLSRRPLTGVRPTGPSGSRINLGCHSIPRDMTLGYQRRVGLRSANHFKHVPHDDLSHDDVPHDIVTSPRETPSHVHHHRAPENRVTDYSAPRSQDWSAYRERALVEGQRFLTAVDGILDVVRAGRSVSEKQGRVPDRSVEAMISTGCSGRSHRCGTADWRWTPHRSSRASCGSPRRTPPRPGSPASSMSTPSRSP